MSLATTEKIGERFDDVTDVTDVISDISPTPGLATIAQPPLSIPDPLGALSHGTGQQDPQPQQDGPDRLAELRQKLDDTLRNPPATIWKPANKFLDVNKPVNGAQNYKDIQGTAKLAAATGMRQDIQLQLAETLRQIATRTPSTTTAETGNKDHGSALGSATGMIARDMVIGGLVMATTGLPGVVATTAMSAASAGLRGQGTLATFDKPAAWKALPTTGKGRYRSNAKDMSSFLGYVPSEQQAQAGPSGPAPAPSAFDKKLNNGPGFGRPGQHDLLARSGLTGQSLHGISALDLQIMTDDLYKRSPVGKAVEGMRENAEMVLKVMDRQKTRGVDATLDNALAAQNMGMTEQLKQSTGPTIQTFVM
jgi:hypothetical protein